MDVTKVADVAAALNGRYSNKAECVELARRLRVHANGELPAGLISIRRPNESEEIKKYREKIYVPKTRNAISKVLHSLEKIRRAQDWYIKYNNEAVPASVAEMETLETYCEKEYPGFGSITNWAFAELLKQSLIDANGIVAVVVDALPDGKGQYCKPVAKFFGSDQIVEFVEDDHIVLKSNDKVEYKVMAKDGSRIARTERGGNVMYLITKTECIRYEQSGTSQYKNAITFTHNAGKLPAWKVGGIFHSRKNNDTIYESRLSGMVPALDEAAREYSDLQAEIVMHIHSERYAYTNTDCPDCKGRGYITIEGKQTTCQRCGGTGHILNTTPYGTILIDPARAGELQLPSPPIGYIQKSGEIAKLQDERVRNHIKDALAAVNMEFLAETPIDQSGVAKAYDANELNNFVNSIAEDLVRNIDNVYYFINEFRYATIVPDKEKRREMLPSVNVPTKFDIANTTILMQELQGARQAEVNPETMRVLETNYAKMQFNTEPEVAVRLETIFDLDPLFGIKEENKMTMLQNNGITETSYIISCNIHAFVRRAIHENKDFCEWPFEKKQELLEKYAEEVRKDAEDRATKNATKALDFGGLEDNTNEPTKEPQKPNKEETTQE